MKQKLLITALSIAAVAALGYVALNWRTNQSGPVHVEQSHTEGPWVTVWVHGTRFLTRPFFKKFFHVDQGLNKATKLGADYHHREIADTLSELNEELFCLDRFYLFGWSGNLSFKARHLAAQQLHDALTLLVADFEHEHNVTPRLRLVTHSHGGNVALNLATVTSKGSKLSIDELVVMACPVQERTKHLVDNSLFKRIYSLYSKGDIIQILDPQGWYSGEHKQEFTKRKWFSERCFPFHPKLKQALITYNGRGIMHAEFLLCERLCGFVQHFPKVLAALAAHASLEQHLRLSINTTEDDDVEILLAAA